MSENFERPEKFCLVGLGAHARSRLIPALIQNGQEIVGLVSRQGPEALPCGPVFATLQAAIGRLPPETCFFLASPPALHFQQAREVVSAGRDLFVEKPAFVTQAQLAEIAACASACGTIVVEAFMHRHTELFDRFRRFWAERRAEGSRLTISFLVPSLPEATFRQARGIESSCVYDIGCYPLSLLADLNIPLAPLALEIGPRARVDRRMVRLSGRAAGVELELRFGVGESYENFAEVSGPDGTSTRFSPFFYGRPGEKCIEAKGGGGSNEERFDDRNGFAAMLATPRANWLAHQSRRLALAALVTQKLEAIGSEIIALERAIG